MRCWLTPYHYTNKDACCVRVEWFFFCCAHRRLPWARSCSMSQESCFWTLWNWASEGQQERPEKNSVCFHLSGLYEGFMRHLFDSVTVKRAIVRNSSCSLFHPSSAPYIFFPFIFSGFCRSKPGTKPTSTEINYNITAFKSKLKRVWKSDKNTKTHLMKYCESSN